MENEIIEDIENTEINEIKPIEPIEPPKPVYIYNYGNKEKEYLFKEVAYKDYEESKKQNKFIALVPAYSTLLEPPEYGKNEIPVYSSEWATESVTEIINEQIGTDEEGNPIFEEKEVIHEVKKLIENWTIKPDYRINFVKVDNDLNVYPITEIGNIEGFLVVDKIIGEEIKKEKDWFKIVDNEVVKKSEKEYEDEKAQKERERLNLLSMTKREMFLGLYQAKGITPDKLKTQITDPQALIEFEYANDYYRGNPLIDVIGGQLGFTSEQLDRFFETKDYRELINDNTTDTTEFDI